MSDVPERCYAANEAGPLVTISLADYLRLLASTEADDMIIRCNTCGAWLDRADEATASVEDFDGCWKMAAGRVRDNHLCRSYRVSEIAQSGSAP